MSGVGHERNKWTCRQYRRLGRGLSVVVTAWMGMPTWLLFLAWLTYFFCGGGFAGLGLQLGTNLFGVMVGVVALGIAEFASAPLWSVAVLVTFAAFTIAQSGRLTWLADGAPDRTWRSGGYYVDNREAPVNPVVGDPSAGAQLWDRSEELLGL